MNKTYKTIAMTSVLAVASAAFSSAAMAGGYYKPQPQPEPQPQPTQPVEQNQSQYVDNTNEQNQSQYQDQTQDQNQSQYQEAHGGNADANSSSYAEGGTGIGFGGTGIGLGGQGGQGGHGGQGGEGGEANSSSYSDSNSESNSESNSSSYAQSGDSTSNATGGNADVDVNVNTGANTANGGNATANGGNADVNVNTGANTANGGNATGGNASVGNVGGGSVGNVNVAPSQTTVNNFRSFAATHAPQVAAQVENCLAITGWSVAANVFGNNGYGVGGGKSNAQYVEQCAAVSAAFNVWNRAGDDVQKEALAIQILMEALPNYVKPAVDAAVQRINTYAETNGSNAPSSVMAIFGAAALTRQQAPAAVAAPATVVNVSVDAAAQQAPANTNRATPRRTTTRRAAPAAAPKQDCVEKTVLVCKAATPR